MVDVLLWLLLFITQGEPYGGCDEAYLYPGTPGSAWCDTFMPQRMEMVTWGDSFEPAP